MAEFTIKVLACRRQKIFDMSMSPWELKCTKILLLDSPHLQDVALEQYCIIQLVIEQVKPGFTNYQPRGYTKFLVKLKEN